MSISETISLNTAGVTGPANIAAAAVNKLAAALRAVAAVDMGSGKAAQVEAIARAAAAGKIDEANAKASGAVRVNMAKVAAQAQLSQQKAVQSAILAAQKSAHAQRLADIKSEQAASVSSIKAETTARKAAAKEKLTEEQKIAKQISEFDAKRYKNIQDQKKRLANMKSSAMGPGEVKDEDTATPLLGGGQYSGMLQKLGMGAGMAGAVGAAAGLALTAVHAVVDEVKAIYEKTIAVISSLGQTGIGMVFAATSARESLIGTISALGKSQETSKQLYEQIVKTSIQTGRDKDALAGEYKRLLSAGFNDKDVGAITKMLGDVAAVKGEGKAGALEKLLTRLNSKGSLDKGVAGAFTKMGLGSQDELYAELAKKLKKKKDDIPALIKAGKISASTAEQAIAAAVEHAVGGAAQKQANSVLMLIARIKTAAEEMFAIDDKAIAPVKTFLNKVLATLMGPEGQALKSAISNLFGSIFHTALDDVNTGNRIGDAFKQMTGFVNMAAKAIRDLRPQVKALLDEFTKLSHDEAFKKGIIEVGKQSVEEKIGEQKDTAKATKAKTELLEAPKAPGVGGAMAGGIAAVLTVVTGGLIVPLLALLKGASVLMKVTDTGQSITRHVKSFFGMDDDDEKATGKPGAKKGAAAKATAGKKQPSFAKFAADDPGSSAAQSATKIPASVTEDMSANMSETGADIGSMLNMGMAEGIESSMDASLAAGGAAAQELIAHVKAILGVQSPSTVFAAIGGFLGAGMAQGISGSTGDVTGAASKMGGDAVKAVVPGAGGAANDNAGGKPGAGSGTYIEHLEIHANSAAEGKEAAEAFKKEMNATVRRVGNEG